jgi:hypothetical protein
MNPAGGDRKSLGVLDDESFFLQVLEKRPKSRARKGRVHLDLVHGDESAVLGADEDVVEYVEPGVFHGHFLMDDGMTASSFHRAVKGIFGEQGRPPTVRHVAAFQALTPG